MAADISTTTFKAEIDNLKKAIERNTAATLTLAIVTAKGTSKIESAVTPDWIRDSVFEIFNRLAP